jgi:hypothetical protein
MLLSELRVASPTLDVDAVLAAHPNVQPGAVWHAGEPHDVRRTHTNNGFNVSVVGTEQTWRALVERTLVELDRLRPLLLDLQRVGVVPEVDFGVAVGTPEAFVRSCHLALDDLRHLVELGVSVCVTAYPAQER